MNNEIKKRDARRVRRAYHVRGQVRGTAERPRLCVAKTNRHISAQLINDDSGLTLVSMGTMMKEMRAEKKGKGSARKVGARIAELAKAKNIQAVVFDRGHHKYHGLLAELADGAREAGLQF